jgi:hypothetical protein
MSRMSTTVISTVIGAPGIVACVLLLTASCHGGADRSVTVPITLDHNRMLVEAEVQRQDGSWCKALLWVDTGNPGFMLSEEFARDLGIDLAITPGAPVRRSQEVPPPSGLRIGGMVLDVDSVTTGVQMGPQWLFRTMRIDANLPSTVLSRYHVVFDYPRRTLTLAARGSQKPHGERAGASVNPKTGIVQIDAVVGGETMSFALDNGASYSLVSGDLLERISQQHPDWPRMTGAVGCANMWGWWPEETAWPVVRVPEILWGATRLEGVGLAGVPDFFRGAGLGGWYSQKTARPVVGFLGPNALKAFRVEIDYANSAVYFEKGAAFETHDMDVVGLTVQPQVDGSYQVIGITTKDGRPSVAGVEPGDLLIEVGSLTVKDATMGAVVDALRGAPGDIRRLVLERNGERLNVDAKVERFL